MKFLRNKDVKINLFFYFILVVIGALIGFSLNFEAGILSVIISTAALIFYLFESHKRYKNMANLSYEINLILHGKSDVNISDYCEGELSLLQSEITKLIIKLKEQNDMLKNDKIKLADSIADISHQIRTPLTSVNLITEALKKDDKNKKNIMEIQKLLIRIDWLISSLLKIAKLDADTVKFKNERIEFEELIKISLAPIEIIMELKEQKTVFDVSGGFTGDKSWSVEAIGNIIKNCSEHMNAGDTLYITAAENAVFSEITIRDTGKGIDTADLPHLFERFYKGKNSSEQSVGIGLALSRMIILKQNGTIKAENHKDGGAVFKIRFYKGTI